MLNQGLHVCRLRQNELERRFAEEWESRNVRNQGRDLIDYMLAEDNNRPCGEVTERDRQVVATVIQWLGSPVGQSFIDTVHGTE